MDRMGTRWRRWLRGPKRGIARGVAVFGSPGFGESEVMGTSLAQCEALRAWTSDHGVNLSGEPDTLEVLDQSMDAWATDPRLAARLATDAGLYFGTVIVGHVPGARWHAWPNGHPVVRLASDCDLDVTALVDRRLVGHGPTLSTIYASASAS
jgi:hypothetical protein